MISATCPNHLILTGRTLNLAGAGRAPGSHAYMSPLTGEVVEVFFAKAVSVGSSHAVATIANNPAMPAVRVEHSLLNGHGPVALGQVLLIAVEFASTGPRAKAAWPADTGVKRSDVQKLGTIHAVKHGYGFITPADRTPQLFFHFTELRGLHATVGTPVRFTPRQGTRGPEACDVRAA